MTAEARLREDVCFWAASLFERGLTGGASGNVSVRTGDGGLLVTPTGHSLGRLEPARLSRFDARGVLIDGDPPTKEMPLHSAFYETRTGAGAVVHLHSTHSVALSMLPGTDPDDVLPPLPDDQLPPTIGDVEVDRVVNLSWKDGSVWPKEKLRETLLRAALGGKG